MGLESRVRAGEALLAAGLAGKVAGLLERAASITNEVWFAGAYVVRVNSRQPGRLQHEAEVACLLPPEAGYPRVIAHGRQPWGEWMVSERVPGRPLSRAWHGMERSARRDAVDQLAARLRALHGVRGVPVPAFARDNTLECPHQLPPERLLDLLVLAEKLHCVDAETIDLARAAVHAGARALEDGPGEGLVHGDVHLENVLWEGGKVTALLDIEWARPGPPDLDLDVFLRFCAHPFLHVADDYEAEARPEDYRDVPGWLRESYPELFAAPRLMERLTLFALAFDVRHLLLTPPHVPLDELSPYHPLRRLYALVRSRSHLNQVLR